MFLRSNLAAAGLASDGSRLAGTWVAAWERDEIAGVAAHFNLGTMVLEAPLAEADLAALACRCAEESGRRIDGLVGPRRDIECARRGLGLAARQTTLDSPELLFALDLGELRLPAVLGDARATFRRAAAGDLDRLVDWRAAYAVEVLGHSDGPAARAAARDEITARMAAGDWFILDWEGEPVSCSAFNARVEDMVQVGGVFTPPALRRRGYARGVVAGSLIAAGSAGASRAILFTDDGNPARRAYEAIGFRVVGDYGLILFAP